MWKLQSASDKTNSTDIQKRRRKCLTSTAIYCLLIFPFFLFFLLINPTAASYSCTHFQLMRELQGQWEGNRELDFSVLAASVWLPWITAQYQIKTHLCDSGIWWSVAVAGLGWWIGQKLFRSQAPLVVRVWVKLWPQFEWEQVVNFLDFEYKNNFHLTYLVPPLHIY